MGYNENIKKVMTKTVNPRELAKEQYDTLKNHIINTLEDVIDDIANDNYSSVIKNNTFQSLSGDCMGTDNFVIDFGFDGTEKDIFEILNQLAFLKSYAEGNEPIDAVYEEYKYYFDMKDV